MRIAAVPCRANEPVHTRRPFGHEYFMDVTFAVAHTHHPRIGTTRLQGGQVVQTFHKFDALVVAEVALCTLTFFAQIGISPNLGLHAQHAGRQYPSAHPVLNARKRDAKVLSS